jgi:hypothetical protein
LFFFAPVASLLCKLVCLIKLSTWIKLHPIPKEFLDYIANKTNIERYDLYEYIITRESLENESVDYLEFGVYKGASLRWWSNNVKNPASLFFGFDTFTGLPEGYINYKKGYFSTNGSLPEIKDGRISYEIGLFQETLAPFLERTDLTRRVIVHMDADLYSSTLFVLTTLVSRLPKGSIIIFDELAGSYGEHEFLAFTDFVSAFYLKYELLGAVRNYRRVAFKLI